MVLLGYLRGIPCITSGRAYAFLVLTHLMNRLELRSEFKNCLSVAGVQNVKISPRICGLNCLGRGFALKMDLISEAK